MKFHKPLLVIYIFFNILILFANFGKTQAAHPPEAAEYPQLLFFSNTSPCYFITIEKKSQKLKLYEQSDSLKLIKEFTCATGENPGNKRASGDSRTPEGIYHITEIYEDKRITVFGSRAFHLDYPNIFDTRSGRLGDGIFIHGTNKKLIPNSTNGCITLNNKDLDELAPYLAVNTLPIIILDSNSDLTLGENLLLEKDDPRFLDAVEKLALAPILAKKDTIQTLSFLQLGEQAVISIRYNSFEKKVTQYNEHKRAYLIQSPTGSWKTVYAVQSQESIPLILAIHPKKNESLVKKKEPVTKIDDLAVTTDDQVPPTKNEEVNSISPMIPPPIVTIKATKKATKTNRSAQTKPSLDKGGEVLAFLEKWRKSWATKDIETYIKCYSPTFKSGALNRDAWREKKKILNQKYKYISVSLQNTVIEWTAAGANVTFLQTYKSDQLETSGKKTLQLINKKNRWMIENEFI